MARQVQVLRRMELDQVQNNVQENQPTDQARLQEVVPRQSHQESMEAISVRLQNKHLFPHIIH